MTTGPHICHNYWTCVVARSNFENRPESECLQIRHDNTVTWLAYWKDPISTKDFKYVWLAANSVFKSDSDLAKYEKARKLKVITCLFSKHTTIW